MKNNNNKNLQSLSYLRQLLLEIGKVKLEWAAWVEVESNKMRSMDRDLSPSEKLAKLLMRKESQEFHERLHGLYSLLSEPDLNKGFTENLKKVA